VDAIEGPQGSERVMEKKQSGFSSLALYLSVVSVMGFLAIIHFNFNLFPLNQLWHVRRDGRFQNFDASMLKSAKHGIFQYHSEILT
jgi:hypothetical protein